MMQALMAAAFVIGAQLGWRSDWFRRLFRMGPYKRPPRVRYHVKD